MTTICVVDDDQTLLDLVAELLRERNWTMLALRDGRGAGEIVRTAAPDAILLDIRLDSDTSGWDVLDDLLAEPTTRSIPVIIWSADAKTLSERRVWLHEAGVRVLAKPFEIDDLFRLLDEVLPEAYETLKPPTDRSA
jgi:CheY-like chemotaxis protein